MLLFDSLTSYEPRPPAPLHGMHAVRILSHDLWPGVSEKSLKTFARIDWASAEEFCGGAAAADALLVLNVEHWAWDGRKADDATVEQSLDWLGKLIDRVRGFEASLRVGLYGWPIREYGSETRLLYRARANAGEPFWDARLPQYEAAAEAWHNANSRWLYGRDADGRFEAEGLADRLDCVCPSLYVPYLPGDPNYAAGDNEFYVAAMLDETRSFGKQVYPFLSFHRNAGAGKPPRPGPMDVAHFASVWAVVKAKADGAILYGGDDGPWGRIDAHLETVRS